MERYTKNEIREMDAYKAPIADLGAASETERPGTILLVCTVLLSLANVIYMWLMGNNPNYDVFMRFGFAISPIVVTGIFILPFQLFRRFRNFKSRVQILLGALGMYTFFQVLPVVLAYV